MPSIGTPTESNIVLNNVIGTDQQKVNWVNTRFINCLQALQPRRTRLFNNLETYAGYQLSKENINQLDLQGRIAIVMDLCTRKVQGLASAIVKNVWDVSYSPIDGKRNSLMFALEDMHEIDKDYSNWRYNFLQHCIYALVNDSCMEMKISNRQDPLGRISWEVCLPGTIAYDPNWRTGISKDLEFCFKYTQLTAEQIMALYPDKTEKIKQAMFSDLQQGGNFDVPKIDAYKDYNYTKTLDGLYNVIEYNYLVEEQQTTEMDIESKIILPDTDDLPFKMAFIQANNIKIENIKAITQTVKRAKILTICPDLVPDFPLYDGYDIMQINRLRFFPMAAERIVGEPRGILDIIIPMQNAINKAINNIQAIIDSGAHGGGAVDPAIVGNNEKKMREIQEHWADPRYKFWTESGALKTATNFFAQFPTTPVHPEMFNHLNTLLSELNNDMIPLNPAAEGKSEHAQEPGIVFNMKMQAIELAQLVLMTNVENFLMEVGEAYLDAAKIFYSNNKRTFYKSSGDAITINDVKIMENGDVVIENDISNIQKCRTLVKLSPDSPNSRFTQRMTQMDVLNLLMKDPGDNAELIAIHQAKLLDTIDYDDDEEKIVAEASQRRIELGRMKVEGMLHPQPQQTQRPPSVSIGYKDLPPQGQTQAAALAGIHIDTPTPQQNPVVGALQSKLSPLLAQAPQGQPQASQMAPGQPAQAAA
jgi:hypothetical protein